MNFSMRKTDTGRGDLLDGVVDDRPFNLHVERRLVGHKMMGSSVIALSTSLADTGDELQAVAQELTPTGFAKQAEKQVRERVAPAFKAVQAAEPRARADLAERSIMFDPKPEGEPAIRAELRAFASSLSLPEVMQASKTDGALANAIFEGGQARSGLPADVFAAIERDARLQRAAAILTGQRTYATVATADDPIGGAVDYNAARVDVEAMLSALDAEAALLDAVGPLLANTVSAVALLLDTSREAAFKALTA